ncbi:uncharacterized protein LOC132201886 isoform X2 [Neocloeon triangulifer]|uniref:uncharacterized protein LOC132201886 isoform X2 n=1 Tax=Neocloeon triangulifer TaxID=2078957 RepID=UPI00286F3CBF|nr:uncharacterized protein LOC132201886 isoform X2 [Neocloeon triangulifer]
MSLRQNLKVCVRLQVMRVKSPGMCKSGSKGDLLLHLWLMDQTLRTSSVPATYPLHFNQTFHISKIYDASDLFSLHGCLASEFARVELQESAPGLRSVAIFKSSLLTLLFPESGSLSCTPTTTLQMQPLCHFSGLLGPELEVSTRVSIQQVTQPATHNYFSPQKRLSSVEMSPCQQVKLANRYSKLTCGCLRENEKKPPFVVRHVDPEIFHLSKTPRSRRIKKNVHYQDMMRSSNQDEDFSHSDSHADCKCSVCCLYEEYFGRPYPQHCPEEDEGVADLVHELQECCCCHRAKSI